MERGLTNGSSYGIISEQTAKRRFFKDKPDPPEKNAGTHGAIPRDGTVADAALSAASVFFI